MGLKQTPSGIGGPGQWVGGAALSAKLPGRLMFVVRRPPKHSADDVAEMAMSDEGTTGIKRYATRLLARAHSSRSAASAQRPTPTIGVALGPTSPHVCQQEQKWPRCAQPEVALASHSNLIPFAQPRAWRGHQFRRSRPAPAVQVGAAKTWFRPNRRIGCDAPTTQAWPHLELASMLFLCGLCRVWAAFGQLPHFRQVVPQA